MYLTVRDGSLRAVVGSVARPAGAPHLWWERPRHVCGGEEGMEPRSSFRTRRRAARRRRRRPGARPAAADLEHRHAASRDRSPGRGRPAPGRCSDRRRGRRAPGLTRAASCCSSNSRAAARGGEAAQVHDDRIGAIDQRDDGRLPGVVAAAELADAVAAIAVGLDDRASPGAASARRPRRRSPRGCARSRSAGGRRDHGGGGGVGRGDRRHRRRSAASARRSARTARRCARCRRNTRSTSSIRGGGAACRAAPMRRVRDSRNGKSR